MRPFNVHALVLALAILLLILAGFGVFDPNSIKCVMALMAAGFAIAATIMLWYIDFTAPPGEKYAPFKSALADYASFWTALSVFLILLLTGELPTG